MLEVLKGGPLLLRRSIGKLLEKGVEASSKLSTAQYSGLTPGEAGDALRVDQLLAKQSDGPVNVLLDTPVGAVHGPERAVLELAEQRDAVGDFSLCVLRYGVDGTNGWLPDGAG